MKGETMPEVIDRKFKFKAVSIHSGKQFTEKNAIVFLAKDALVPALLKYYEQLCRTQECDERQIKAVELLRERVEKYQAMYPRKVSFPDVAEGEEEKRVCKPNKD